MIMQFLCHLIVSVATMDTYRSLRTNFFIPLNTAKWQCITKNGSTTEVLEVNMFKEINLENAQDVHRVIPYYLLENDVQIFYYVPDKVLTCSLF
jgi:hypothetical protein